jgi:hypothetical protein
MFSLVQDIIPAEVMVSGGIDSSALKKLSL